MIRRPPRSTRTDTLFPYTTLFRSNKASATQIDDEEAKRKSIQSVEIGVSVLKVLADAEGPQRLRDIAAVSGLSRSQAHRYLLSYVNTRSEERRVGKECVSTCRSRWSPYH